MFIIKTDPSFDQNMGDPAMSATMMLAAKDVASSMDSFIRQCVSKVLSPESLELFVGMQSAVPELDLEITFFSPQKRRMRLLFRKEEIGSAISESSLEEREESGEKKLFLVHKITIEKI